jgi:hypothetical protein
MSLASYAYGVSESDYEDAASQLFGEDFLHYVTCREGGTSHRLALMFALSRPPMSNTDREFLEGHCNGSQFEDRPDHGDAYQAVAAEEGVDTTGAVYMSGLAAYPGDPRAWIRGRDDARKVCEERGWDCDGAVTVRAAVRNPAPGPVVADDILDDAADRLVEDHPVELSAAPRQELKEMVLEKRRPHWKE